MFPVTERPTAKKSVLVTVLLFGLVPLLNAEILTGSTSIDALLANPVLIIVALPLVLVTYAVPLAILGDLAARFSFGFRTIFLSGLVYGIINEGVFAKTLVAPYWPGVQFGNFRFLGLNILWLPSILVFHAVVSTTVTILVIRSLWPERVSESFLERKHYVALAAVLAVAIAITNIVFVPFIASGLGYPPPFDPMPFLLLLALSFFFVLLIKKSLGQKRPAQGNCRRTPTVMYVLLGAGIFLLANIVSRFALAIVGLWLAVTAITLFGYLFYRYFGAIDSDTELTKRKTFLVYSTFIVIVLFVGFGGRQPLSNLTAFLGVVLELSFGWRAAHIQTER